MDQWQRIHRYSPEPYIIAEIGGNHCGNLDIAKNMARDAALCGVNAIKFQKRTLEAMYAPGALDAPYENENSYGRTYGEHRRAIDWFGFDEFRELREIVHSYGKDFIVTPFDEVSAEFCRELDVDVFKIASCDLTHIPLICQIASYCKPVIISTGGGTWEDVYRAYSILRIRCLPWFAMMHCVSTYPNTDEDLNLIQIDEMVKRYPGAVIGFSSHHQAIMPLILAYQAGARVFEVHYTFNRAYKGTDHAFSMEPNGLRKICDDIHRIPAMLGGREKKVSAKEASGFVYKMGKSIYPRYTIPEGAVIGDGDICFRAPAAGMKPYQVNDVLFKKTKRILEPHCAIQEGDLI